MADEKEPVAPATLTEEYELGDSELDPELDQHPAPTSPSREDETPRGPDGRFLPRAPEAPPEPAKPKHSPRLVRMAKDLGMAPEDIDALSADDLENEVYILQRELAAVVASNRANNYVKQPEDPLAPDTKPRPANKDEQPKDEFALDLPEFVDADLANVLKSAFGAQAKRIAELENHVKHLYGAEIRRQHETRNQTIDRVFDEFADPATFGKGPGARMTADSPEFMRRRALLSVVQLMAKEPGTLEDKMHKVRATLYPTQAKATATPAPEPEPAPTNGSRITPEQWNEAALAQPTHREMREPKGERRAVKAVAAKMRDMGYGNGDEESSLPD